MSGILFFIFASCHPLRRNVLASRTLDSPFIHFERENINQIDLQDYTRKGPYYDKLMGVLKFELGTDVRPKVSTTIR